MDTKPSITEPRDAGRSALVALFVTTLAIVGWIYFPTFESIVLKWDSDATFSHGILIVPISLWLVWRLRHEVLATPWRPSFVGAAMVAMCALLWIVARGSGVLVLEQFAAVAFIPALVFTAFGWGVIRVLLMPLGFLFFMVPFGRALVPMLMQMTADISTILLHAVGVPVLQSYMYLTIPSGQFEVARACSGLNYFITSFVLGVLYAYLNYRSWFKRIACVAAFLVFPVALNILRVFVIVVVSHLTDFEFGPGAEHIVFGRVFFLAVILVLFMVGRRWHDDFGPATASPDRPPVAAWPSWWPVLLAGAIALAGPPLVADAVARAEARVTEAAALVQLPVATADWTGPAPAQGRWKPQFGGGIVEQRVVYTNTGGSEVELFVAVYGLGATLGSEMVTHANVITRREHGSLALDTRRTVDLPGGSLTVRELALEDAGRLVWTWYVVGDTPVVSPYAAKALEAVGFVTRNADLERVVVISTVLDAGAPERLRGFLQAQGQCARAGFPGGSCGE